ncbi:MAG: DUF4258 domain-containing protein [Moorea sp. SIO1F2]|uniref:DUF4258 domain-containing protein n=1 Tax=unclassified Moorena TaxID=2683338 RepID=UPI0013B5EC6E|nr:MULTISPECIES: DUF4258 domain-containing protein [unclassified Moorena]NEN95578.1 DUF4258 domain-containing protein [Moorena sp. SIO3I7]NEO06948.1 DUF4258 domain-containing protein [Moorena sp. SIO3I8]NEO22223.1 DUF4258 domain-containing protein [Moorena sp. SIO4A5]NEP23979.1 DUF4258 domain-containing protein [Moorena sp. SIO3I6]NEQ61443.1 DUF4258 domain-containing protein [Moorena sp. SIO4A1]
MFAAILEKIQDKILRQQYVMTIHADEEMDDDNLMLADVEQAILTGEIIERQKDRATAEYKYRIQGYSTDGDPVEVIVKLGSSGKVIIITVYAL